MKIGILSDTHNNRANLAEALRQLSEAGVETIFHCGDLTSVEMIPLLGGFTVHYTWGNGDSESGEIERLLRDLDEQSTAGLTFSGEVDGRRIAATHGHLPGRIDQLLAEERYDYIFHGHSHRRKDQVSGATRVINPGALGGLRTGPRSFAVLDLELDELEFIELE